MGVVVKDLRALKDLQRRLLGAAAVEPELTKRLGVAFMKEVADEFRQSRDPYGKPWAPVVRNRKRDRRARAKRAAAGKPPKADKPLIDTGRMRASVVARTERSTVRIAIPVQYASFHQDGTKRIPRRQMLPDATTGGLGPRWSAVAQREAIAVLNKHFGGKK